MIRDDVGSLALAWRICQISYGSDFSIIDKNTPLLILEDCKNKFLVIHPEGIGYVRKLHVRFLKLEHTP